LVTCTEKNLATLPGKRKRTFSPMNLKRKRKKREFFGLTFNCKSFSKTKLGERIQQKLQANDHETKRIQQKLQANDHETERIQQKLQADDRNSWT
jgi:hypothetical protein